MRTVQDLTATEQAVLERLREGVARALPDRPAHVTLFGSRARGDGDPDADLDVYVEVETERLTSAERRRIKDLAGALSLETGFVVCLLIADKTILRERGDYSVFENIRAEGIAV